MPGYTLLDGFTVKNKLGAASHDELEKLETEPVRYRIFQLEFGFGPKGQFDAAHLKAIHQHLFQDVFEWARHTRDERVTLSDGAIASEPVLRKANGQLFLAGPAIPAALDATAAKLDRMNCLRGLSRMEFAGQAADIMAELNAIHPFREGNGRTQCVFWRSRPCILVSSRPPFWPEAAHLDAAMQIVRDNSGFVLAGQVWVKIVV